MRAVKNQYFLKDKKAQIYKSVYVKDDRLYDSPTEYYVAATPSPSWCYSKQLTQALISLLDVAYQPNETRYFVFNYTKLVNTHAHILYRGEMYKVTRVDTQDDYNREIFAYVENMNLSHIVQEYLRPYGWEPANEGLEKVKEF